VDPGRPRPGHAGELIRVLGLLIGALVCGCASGAHGDEAASRVSEAETPLRPAQIAAAPHVAAIAASSASTSDAGISGPKPAPRTLNVLLITVDAMRADMPWAGYPRPIAPNLTAFEAESASYARAYAISSYTAMSIGGFLSGRFPSEMERSGMFFSAYPDSELLFPELLQKAGIRTLTAHAHFYFDVKAGFRQGFDVYRMVEGLTADNKTDRNVTAPRHLASAIEILSDPANTSVPFFAWFHFMDPHDVYVRHEGVPDFGSRARDRYDGEIAFTDQHVGRLLEFVTHQSWAERTAVIVNSDHGEAFGEHGRTRHGFEIWEPLVHVPLLLRIPGVAARRIDEPRSMMDLVPTIFDLLGVPPHPGFQGRSLVPELRGEVLPEPRDVIVDLPRTSDNDRRRALVFGRYKLISFGDDFRFELYDVVDDPGEERDLRSRRPEIYRMMRQRYAERSKGIHDVCPMRRDRLMGKHASRPC